MKKLPVAVALVLALAPSVASAAEVQKPEQFFGFKIGTDGELARYPKVVEYLQHLAQQSDRVRFQELGKTTLGNPYVLATFSAPANLGRLDRLVEINRKLADPRGLSPEEAMRLAREGRPFYFLYATIHSTEVGNGQAIIEIAHRLATESSPEIQEILENAVLLLVPSQNPDGQVLVIDHWYKTKGTSYNRVYPDLYHHYVGHDDNRDWFMFTQKETRLNIEKVQNVYRPQVTHDMHQQGQFGSRIFVPPFQDPYDRNFHPILAQGQAQIGLAMAAALVAEGKAGVAFNEQYDLWTPARQYMVYHGQPRILTEIASVNLADPLVNPAGRDRPLGSQERRMNFPLPYTSSEWRLGQIVDYGVTVVFAGLSHLAKYRTTWLENFYKVHRDWVEWKDSPYAFVISAEQRDRFETFELLQILDFGDVEVHRARSGFSAGGKTYPAGSFVVRLAQPYGAFAKTMLEEQVYPDLRFFPGGPPIPPYDVTGHTLGMLMGVAVEPVEKPFSADLELLKEIRPPAAPAPARPKWAYLVGPESNAGFLALARLQKENLPIFRASAEFTSGGKKFAPGTWVVPANGSAGRVLESVSRETGLSVFAADQSPGVAGYRMKSPTRIGLWKGANNMPAGWLKWLFEQYGFTHERIASTDFKGALSAKYDVIVLPSGTTKRTIVQGLDKERNDASWEWAYGVGDAGWEKLAAWVREGGTLVAIGTAVETAVELFDLPLQKVLPDRPVRFRPGPAGAGREGPQIPEAEALRQLRTAFQSPANLIQTLQDKVVDPTSLFYCPGSLLRNQFDPAHPVAYGMPAEWPIFFEHDQAYRLRPAFGMKAEVAARYPKGGPIRESGWLLGEDFLRDQLNVVSFEVGRGKVVTLGSQVDFRTQPRATFKLLFNAIFQGPATRVSAAELSRLSEGATAPTGQP
jgi:hypothetical protein